MTPRYVRTSLLPLAAAIGCAALSSPVWAGDCRSLTGETLSAAQTGAFSLGVKGCDRSAAAAPPAAHAPLSPLLRLYETPRASVDVSARRAPRAMARSIVVAPGAPASRRSRRAAPVAAAPRRAAPPTPVAAPSRPYVRAAVDGRTFLAVARAYDIDPVFLASVIRQESGGRTDAVSGKGARGLMQVMPGTAAHFGVDRGRLANPVVNLATGAYYLKTLQRRYGNNLPLILAAYNAGEGAVDRHGRRVPPYRETQGYVGSILGGYRSALTRAGGASAR